VLLAGGGTSGVVFIAAGSGRLDVAGVGVPFGGGPWAVGALLA